MTGTRVRLHDRIAVCLVLCGFLAGCAGGPKPAPRTAPPPPPALDASYDWRVLVPAPFGSKLKDLPFTLHEVLLFKDSAKAAVPADEVECFSRDEPPARFVGHKLDQYVLCFKHDRLARIEAAVLVERYRAAQTFADACSAWQKGAAAVPPLVAGPAAADASGAESAVCAGQTGTVTYSAHLDDATADDVPLSIRLDGALDQT